MATVLGACIDLDHFSASVTGLGNWNPLGIFTVTLPNKGSCGGSGGGDGGRCRLTINACGKVRVSIAGTGYKYSPYSAQASAEIVGGLVLANMQSPGGGSPTDHCATGDLEGTPEGEADMGCGMQLDLLFGRNDYGGPDWGEISVTFTVSVAPW